MKGSKLFNLQTKILILVCCIISLFGMKYISAEDDLYSLSGILMSTEPSTSQKGDYDYFDENTLFKKSSSNEYAAGKLTIGGGFLQIDDNSNK